MLLQRLVDSETEGFGFDYMGASEYENGATTNGMAALARLFLDGRLVARKTGFAEIHHRMCGEYVTVLALASARDARPARRPHGHQGDTRTLPCPQGAHHGLDGGGHGTFQARTPHARAHRGS